MIRARFVFAATLVGAALAAGSALAQAPAAPDFQPILAGKDFKPPVRGAADVEFTKPVTKRERDMVVDKVMVRNMSTQPIARLTVEAIYYDKGGQVIANGKGFISGLLAAGEGRDRHGRDAVQREDELEQLQVHPRQRQRERPRRSTRSTIPTPPKKPVAKTAAKK